MILIDEFTDANSLEIIDIDVDMAAIEVANECVVDIRDELQHLLQIKKQITFGDLLDHFSFTIVTSNENLISFLKSAAS